MSRIGGYDHNDDLVFFGNVNASISHELKNIMAIISETAGLMHDLLDMASRGKSIDSEMMMNCSKDIMEEIQRGFETIKQMNRFSHSVDEMLKTVPIMEPLEMMVGLAGFLSFACKVEVECQGDNAYVLTFPFRLQHLIYRALVFSFKSVGPHGRIHVTVDSGESESVRIAFSGLLPEHLREFPTPQLSSISEVIHADIRANSDASGFDIIMPRQIEA